MCWYWRNAIKVNMEIFVTSFLIYVTPLKNCKLLLLLHTISAEVFLQKFDFQIISSLSLKLYASFLLEGFGLQRSYLTFQIYYFSLHILITHKIENAQKAIIRLKVFFPLFLLYLGFYSCDQRGQVFIHCFKYLLSLPAPQYV